MFESLYLAFSIAAVSLGAPAETAAPIPLELVAQAGSDVQVGTSTAGDLSPSDDVMDGRYADRYTFEADAGDRVRISLRSNDIDAYVAVSGPNGFSVSNDDSPGRGTNSMIVVSVQNAGTYEVTATSYAAGEVGAYTLVVDQWTPNTQIGGQATAPTSEPGIRSGATNGSLDSGDNTLSSGELFDAFVYEGSAGERLSITLRTDEFDPYLMVRGPGVTEDNDDAVEGDLNSALGITLPSDGAYRIIATTYAPGEQGAYTLNVESGGRSATAVVDGQLRNGQPVEGAFSSADAARQGGQYFESWSFQGSAGDSVTVELSSSNVDTFLTLRSPGGSEESNDDISRRDTNSRINMILPTDGTYEVLASTYLSGAEGEYTLSLRQSDHGPLAQDSLVGQDAATEGELMFGSQIEGRLNRRDTQLASGEYYDTIMFNGRAGQGVTLRMESSHIDTYVMLRGPGGLSIDNDDGPDGTNSHLEATLPQDGEYSILATSYSPGETGRYTIRLEEGTRAEQNATGRVYAILAGITDYQDSNDLPFCAEDAEKLGEELTETGIMADESIILTNSQVTRQNLEDAFMTVAQAAGPDDVFLFFYSGHGAYLEGRSELDDRDETLYVVDGHITDDEVNSWFDEVNARMAIIALDSCFSGGFARDVISAPDRMGIFSSEEDVTSNVASRFQAGGYLSYFLRRGIGGEADVSPRDGIITAGELSQYLHIQWAEHNMANERTETADAATAYQNLVIDRGSVKVTDVIVYNE